MTFDLIITADPPSHSAEFRLIDEHGAQLAFRRTDFKSISVGHQQGLFDLRNFVRNYADAGREGGAVAEIGVCIAEEILGDEIFAKLWLSQSQRTLRIQLPGAGDLDNELAGALARVPWEIARPAPDQATLGERNLVVRVVHDMRMPDSEPLELADGEPLRVLFVFAEARGSRPLGARQERRELLRMLDREVYPKRLVVAHFLSHGVTRERLESQIRDHGGYHVVHWSGHGHHNLLELARPGGKSDRMAGEQLLALFTKAGGFLPRLVFLSACHSGDISRVRDWDDFIAVAQGREPLTVDGAIRKLDLGEQPGFTSTAHALLRGGVPSVVAMRYAVGDEYARKLAVEFYRALLGHTQPKKVAAALTLARQAMLDDQKHEPSRFGACDHATPLLYGAEHPGLVLSPGRSTESDRRDVRLHAISELTTASHEHFVGRTWELAGLGADFIGSSDGIEIAPLAVITGLGGMGKTALVAEALALWEPQFDWVLLYQAKPGALAFETMLRDIDLRLRGELGRYHEHVRKYPADAVYRDASAELSGSQRVDRLIRNLVRALKAEAILLVLDNFETNLKPAADGARSAHCQDPAWDQCLATLARDLAGTRSRVLVTCRHALAVLGDSAVCAVQLGPLPAQEAALFLRAHPALSRMVFAADSSERALAFRLLNASRFHPLLMDRLARLAADASLRSQLLQALDALETTKEFADLPTLFATRSGDSRELAYLTDALTTSLDQLIREASRDARRVLWMIAVANEPVTLGLLDNVWTNGEDPKLARLQEIKKLLDTLSQQTPEMQAELHALSREFVAVLDALPPTMGQIELLPLLGHLVSVGLATEERADAADDNPELTCHELVRERIRQWMALQPEDRGGWSENSIRIAYARRLVDYLDSMEHEHMAKALHAGSLAVVYCVQAQDWNLLCQFASRVVTGARDPGLLEALMPHLRTAVEQAPDLPIRWQCLATLADELRISGRVEASHSFYERAAEMARSAAEAGGEPAKQAWAHLAAIVGNWAIALRMTGDLESARQLYIESAAASREANQPEIHVIASELEAIRVNFQMLGSDVDSLPLIQTRLAQVEAWWQQHRAGESVPAAPNVEFLVRVYIGALDIANTAYRLAGSWELALRNNDAILALKRELQRPDEDIAGTRMNRAVELGKLERYTEARTELETCLQIFHNNPALRSKVFSALADLYDQQGDKTQAVTQGRRALALCELLPDPEARASSHNNLAVYLERNGLAVSMAEARQHRLADLCYCVVSGLGESLRTTVRNYTGIFKAAHVRGAEPEIPRLADVVADPAFHPLAEWLEARRMDLGDAQALIDHVLDSARSASSA